MRVAGCTHKIKKKASKSIVFSFAQKNSNYFCRKVIQNASVSKKTLHLPTLLPHHNTVLLFIVLCVQTIVLIFDFCNDFHLESEKGINEMLFFIYTF
jgi:hypothetical protein